jgi:aspartate ammonia-lyase
MGYRIEKDFLGEKQIPDDAYYGVQTLRGMENFFITGMPVSRSRTSSRPSAT